MFSHHVFWAPLGPQKSHRIPCGQIHGALVCLFLAMVSCPACWNFAKARDLGLAFIAFAQWGADTEEIFPCSQCSECIVTIVPFPGWFWFDSLIPMIFASSHHSKYPGPNGQIPLSQRPLLTEFFSVWQCNVPSVPWVPWAATLTPSRAIRGSNAARTRSKTDLANSGALQNPVPRSHGSWFLHVPTWQFCCS